MQYPIRANLLTITCRSNFSVDATNVNIASGASSPIISTQQASDNFTAAPMGFPEVTTRDYDNLGANDATDLIPDILCNQRQISRTTDVLHVVATL